MKLNEVRLPFRILAGIFVIPMWPLSIFLGVGWIFAPLDFERFTLFIGVISLSFLFSYAAIKGTVPKFLLGLFSDGPVGDKDDYK